MFEHMLRLDVRYHDANSHGDLMSRFTNDVDLVQEGLSTAAASMVVNAMTLVGTIAYMIYLSPILSLVTLGIIPLLTLMSRTIVKFSRRYAREQQQALGKLNGYIEESVEGQVVMQLFNHEDDSFEEMSYLSDFIVKDAFGSNCFGHDVSINAKCKYNQLCLNWDCWWIFVNQPWFKCW